MKQILMSVLAGVVIVSSGLVYAQDVYVTKNGKKYHQAECLLIQKKGAQPIAMEEALKKDLKPCKKCFSGSADVPAAAANPSK